MSKLKNKDITNNCIFKILIFIKQNKAKIDILKFGAYISVPSGQNSCFVRREKLGQGKVSSSNLGETMGGVRQLAATTLPYGEGWVGAGTLVFKVQVRLTPKNFTFQATSCMTCH